MDKYHKSVISMIAQTVQAKIDFLKWYLSVNSSEIYGKFRVFRPKKIKKINFSLYSGLNIYFAFHLDKLKKIFLEIGPIKLLYHNFFPKLVNVVPHCIFIITLIH
jgi:hypothetical protein